MTFTTFAIIIISTIQINKSECNYQAKYENKNDKIEDYIYYFNKEGYNNFFYNDTTLISNGFVYGIFSNDTLMIRPRKELNTSCRAIWKYKEFRIDTVFTPFNTEINKIVFTNNLKKLNEVQKNTGSVKKLRLVILFSKSQYKFFKKYYNDAIKYSIINNLDLILLSTDDLYIKLKI